MEGVEALFSWRLSTSERIEKGIELFVCKTCLPVFMLFICLPARIYFVRAELF
jgi:hypothetical protein